MSPPPADENSNPKDDAFDPRSPEILDYISKFTFRLVLGGTSAGSEEARELVQEVYLRYLRKPPECTTRGQVKAYASRMVVYMYLEWKRARDRARKKFVGLQASAFQHQELQPTVPTVADRDQTDLIFAVLDELDQADRDLILTIYRHRSLRQAADEMGLSESTVWSRHWRIITSIRSKLSRGKRELGSENTESS